MERRTASKKKKFSSKFDVLGAYTGVDYFDPSDKPTIDADDL